MRPLASLLAALPASAVLLLGCDARQPLEPFAADARFARSGPQLSAPTLTSVSASWPNQSDSQLDITWQDNSSNETNFEIHRSTTGENGAYSAIAGTGAGNVVTYTDAMVLPGAQYCYRIRAVRVIVYSATSSAFSNTVCATIPSLAPLGAPASTRASVTSPSAITVGWQDRSSAEAGFEVRNDIGAVVGRTAANATAFVHAGLVANTRYCYQLRAFAVAGTDTTYSASSSIACATTPNGPPEPVPYVGVYPSTTDVEVRWTQVTGAMSYGIDRSTDGGATWSRVGTASVYTYGLFHDAPVFDARQLCYRVIASNVVADASPSPTACAPMQPLAPTSVTMRSIEAGALELTWSDASAIEDGYEVRFLYPQCSNDGTGSWYCFDDEIILATLPANSTSYRLPDWVSVDDVGRVIVYATQGGVYSEPAYATYAITP